MVVPSAIRAAIVEHAHAEQPNEACGLLLLDGDVAVRYVPGTNATPSPYRFALELPPAEWADINDSELDQAIVHSHISSPPRPSKTDVKNIGLWEGHPYLIYCVAQDDLAAWRIQDGQIVPIEIRPSG